MFSARDALCRCQACSVGFYLPYENLDSACLSCQDVISGSTTPQAGTTSANDCICPEGTYVEPATSATNPQFRGRCVECPRGAVCPAGSDLASIKLQPGYWRTSTSSSDVKACENPDACVGGDGAGTCAEGYTGPVCAVCDDGYSEGARYRECTPCDTVLLTRVLMVLVFIVLPVVWLLTFVWINAARIRDESRSTTPSRAGWVERWFVVDWSAYDKVVGSNTKLLVAYYQVRASPHHPAACRSVDCVVLIRVYRFLLLAALWLFDPIRFLLRSCCSPDLATQTPSTGS